MSTLTLTPRLSLFGPGPKTLGLAGLSIGVRLLFTIFIFLGLGLSTTIAVPPGLMPLQDVLVAKGTSTPSDGADKITSAKVSDGVVRPQSFILFRNSVIRVS